MRVGLIARSEDRGLGNMTWEWAQHMHPERVLLVVPHHRIRQRYERFPGATVVRWDHAGPATLDQPTVRAWLTGLDVVYSAETFYDWRVCDWARDAGVRTVCHVMPEYFKHGHDLTLPAPDVWWTPTTWRLDHLPLLTRVVPVPIALERFTEPATPVPGAPIRWLHTAGAKAAADRNGTRIVLTALRFLRGDHHVTIRAQGEPLRRPATARGVQLTMATREVDEYWHLYGGADALLLPRRYAGLSLPALEAMGAGLALIMSNVEPQRSEWPIIPIDAPEGGRLRTGAGVLSLANVAPRDLAAVMDAVAADRACLAGAQADARSYAEAHSWANLERVHRSHLAAALL